MFSHHSAPVTHESGRFIITIRQNASEFNFTFSTETSVELKKFSVSFCMVALYLNQEVGEKETLKVQK